MGWKGFLKPRTLVLFILFFVGSFYFSGKIFGVAGGPTIYGYPFGFMQFSGCYGPIEESFHHCWETGITSYLGLLGDVIIWYLVAGLIMLIINKFRKWN